jgi:oxygen-independent coproporphyrinogen-3 oxidase
MTATGDRALGLYLSIPFCRSKCTYCNFASGVYPVSEHRRYVDRLVEDLAAASSWAARTGVELPRRVDTVYLGGGTPTLLAPDLIEQLFCAMRSAFDLDPDAEITVECAPGQLPDSTLSALVAAGVNRVSLGVQSFIDKEAATSGRLHTRSIVEDDLRRLRQAGIANLNIDLIAGLAGQTFASWEQSLTALIESGVPHASIYMLEVDEDSRLGREMLAGGARYHAGLVPNDDAIAQMYTSAIEKLGRAGLAQYEISNFSRPGFASRHNLRYWQRSPYLGLGLDASSMLREDDRAQVAGELRRAVGRDFSPGMRPEESAGALAPEVRTCGDSPSLATCSLNRQKCSVLRTTTSGDLAAWLAAAQPAETTWLSPAQQHEEAWFLGLRLNRGIEIPTLQHEFGEPTVVPALETAARLADAGLVARDGATVRLTPQGRLLSNEVFQEFLAPTTNH